MRDEVVDVGFVEVARVAQSMEVHEAPDPLHVGFFGADAQMLDPTRLADLGQQFHGVGSCFLSEMCYLEGVRMTGSAVGVFGFIPAYYPDRVLDNAYYLDTVAITRKPPGYAPGK